MIKRLEAVILPTKIISLEWEETEEKVRDISVETEELLHKYYLKSRIKAFFVSGLIHETIQLSPTLNFWRKFAAYFIKQLLIDPEIEKLRENIVIPLFDTEIETWITSAPPMVGIEFLNKELLKKIWSLFHDTFKQEIHSFKGSVESYIQKLTPNHELSNRIHFHLVENKNSEEFPFAFMATFSTSIDKNVSVRHVPLQFALKKYQKNSKKMLELLSTVHRASKKSKLIPKLLESGELFHPIMFDTQEAYDFLSEVHFYEEAGILCRIPRWWAGKTKKVSVGLSVGNSYPGKTNANSILDFKACLHIDGEIITEKEARRILEQYKGLAFFKGKWIAVDRELLSRTLTLFKDAKIYAEKNNISLSDAMQLLMGNAQIDDKRIEDVDTILCGDWLKSVLEKLTNPSLIRSIKPGKKVKATLRSYQRQGLNWLNFIHSLNFGMCLADDMGLGKTVQVLALLQTLKEREKSRFKTSLLIVPASIMSNWQQEIKKFTPHLKIVVAHQQIAGIDTFKNLPKLYTHYDIILTSFAMARKLEWLQEKKWYYVILDEAQAIKNPSAAQTKAVKKLFGEHKLILTGTPVENRLTDLWSLFDFINPGLLGNVQKFAGFMKGLPDNPEVYTKLRQVIRPYILRRLKTDKSIISDLPEKIEMKCYAELTKVQIVLYKDLVNEFETLLKESEGIKRRGLILGYLIKFKQLCNHPDHFSGIGEYKEKHSGKFSRLRDICRVVYEKREKILVFTQFKEIIKPLDSLLSSLFNRKGFVISGATAVKKRKDMISLFQSDDYIPYFILTLKAGGVGINLTAASHVVHFDRWWNPAVENQATDRAFRIGQKKNVVVHKFISKGTIEEKIDEMIEEKKKLSSIVLDTSSENWITEFTDEQLIEMFKLNFT